MPLYMPLCRHQQGHWNDFYKYHFLSLSSNNCTIVTVVLNIPYSLHRTDGDSLIVVFYCTRCPKVHFKIPSIFHACLFQDELEYCIKFLEKEMGLRLKPSKNTSHLPLSKDEINTYVKNFQRIDTEKKGYITLNDLRRFMKVTCYILASDIRILSNARTTTKYFRIEKCCLQSS